MATGADLSAKPYTLVMQVASLVTTGDGKATITVPRNSYVINPIVGSLGTLGTGAGSTDIQIRNSTDTVDMLTSDKLSFATTDSDKTVEGTLASTQSSRTVDDGDVLCVDVDSISTSATERDLTITMQLMAR